MQKLSARLREHDTAAASVEHDEVLHEDGRALRLACHVLPCTNNAALEVFCDRNTTRSISSCKFAEMHDTHRGFSAKVTAT